MFPTKARKLGVLPKNLFFIVKIKFFRKAVISPEIKKGKLSNLRKNKGMRHQKLPSIAIPKRFGSPSPEKLIFIESKIGWIMNTVKGTHGKYPKARVMSIRLRVASSIPIIPGKRSKAKTTLSKKIRVKSSKRGANRGKSKAKIKIEKDMKMAFLDIF